jgi:hypothetical protein
MSKKEKNKKKQLLRKKAKAKAYKRKKKLRERELKYDSYVRPTVITSPDGFNRLKKSDISDDIDDRDNPNIAFNRTVVDRRQDTVSNVVFDRAKWNRGGK